MTRRIYIPLVLTLVFLALVAVVLVLAGHQVSKTIEEAFSGAGDVRAARITVARTISLQLDEETGVRGYATVRQRILLQPYYSARAALPVSFARLRQVLTDLKMPGTRAVLEDAVRTNRRWVAVVAYPVITFRRVPARVQLRGKRLVDRFRTDLDFVENSLAARANQAQRRAQQAIYGVTLFAIGAVAAVIVAATLFAIQQYRLAVRLERTRERAEEERRRAAESRSAYEAEKRIADTLQGAFTQNLLPRMARVLFSATYLPAAEEARIGGDWYDVLELTEYRVLLTIGDVTGHGIDAAVAMNRARQLLISCALVDPNPGAILERANADLFRKASPLITAVTGIVRLSQLRIRLRDRRASAAGALGTGMQASDARFRFAAAWRRGRCQVSQPSHFERSRRAARALYRWGDRAFAQRRGGRGAAAPGGRSRRCVACAQRGGNDLRLDLL